MSSRRQRPYYGWRLLLSALLFGLLSFPSSADIDRKMMRLPHDEPGPPNDPEPPFPPAPPELPEPPPPIELPPPDGIPEDPGDPEPDPDSGPPQPPTSPATCGGVLPLSAGEVTQLLQNAAALLDSPAMTLAVVDRAGRVLGIFRRGLFRQLEDEAVGLARTAAFFSNDQAPLSSRTVRFISGIHFPPGIPNTPNAALYGIENTNRGCDLGIDFNHGREIPPARSVVFSGDCTSWDTFGCGPGPITGKVDLFDSNPTSVNPGGLPIYRGSTLVGGLGVAGTGPARAEFAAFNAILQAPGLSPAPNPLPAPGVVFIDGIRLPFVRHIERPAGSAPGNAADGVFVLDPRDGGCVPSGYLAGPLGGGHLSRADVEAIVERSRQTAGRTRAVIRLPLGSRARMVIAVSDLNGEILALFRMRDATVFSVDVAVAKARNVVYFSSAGAVDLPGVPPGVAVTNRTISFGAQPLFPPGIDGTGAGPFFSLFESDSRNPCSQGSQPKNAYQNGVVFFPGSIPLYRGNQLVGGLGISGDGVEQDDYVSLLGATGFLPPDARRADRVQISGVRLPFLKLPRNPER